MLILGIDLGTSGCKAIAVDETGAVAGEGYESYGIIAGGDGFVEQDPLEWRRALAMAVLQATAALDRSKVCALSLSTQGASSLLTDGEFHPLMRAVTWMDTRATAQAEAIERELGCDYIYYTTGWRSLASMDLAKGRWLAENVPDISRRARHFISTLEYANFFLTGVPAIDPTNAAMRQMYDFRTGRWDPTLLEAARIDQAMMPPVLPSGEFLGYLTAEAAAELALGKGVKVYNGAHDQYCGALGLPSSSPASSCCPPARPGS